MIERIATRPHKGRLHDFATDVVLLLILIALAGCSSRTTSTVEMSVEDGVMRRGILSDGDSPSPADFQTFEPGRLDNGTDGEGWFLYKDTSMGSLNLYVERFGETLHLASDIDSRRFAAARGVDLLLAWLDSEFISETGYDEFRRFVDTEFRDDIDNLIVYIWGYDVFGPSLTAEDDYVGNRLGYDLFFQVGQYLEQVGYFDPGRTLDILNTIGQSSLYDNPQPLIDYFAHAVARRMGVPEGAPLPAVLEAIRAQPHRYSGSIAYFLRESLAQRTLINQWARDYPEFIVVEPPDIEDEGTMQGEDAVPVQPEVESSLDEMIVVGPDPDSVDAVVRSSAIVVSEGSALSELATQAFGSLLTFWPSTQGLHAILRLPVDPLESNGQATVENSVEWTETIWDEDQTLLPFVLYAVWVEPDISFQSDHFGDVVLDGNALRGYVIWHAQLEEEHAREWDEYLAAQRPVTIDSLTSFHFADETPEEHKTSHISEDGQRVEIRILSSRAQSPLSNIIHSLMKIDAKGGAESD
jgi:hypothetical protein